MTQRFKISWFLIAFLFGWVMNEVNLHFVKQENPADARISEKSTMYGYTIYNIDNLWYLPQIHYLLNGDGYTLDPKNTEMRVRRTPVYPLFYGLHYYLFGEEYSFFMIRYTQLALMALAGILLGMIVLNYTNDHDWARRTTMLFSLSPFIFIFSYHTITEGLTPFLVVLPVYFASQYHLHKRNLHLFFCGIALALTMLNRPLTGILLPALFISWLDLSYGFESLVKRLFERGVILLVSMTAIFLPWVTRNYYATNGQLVILEKYYYDDPMDFGAGHYFFREWVSCWANPATVSADQFSNQLRDRIAQGKRNNDSLIDGFLANVPEYGFRGSSKEELRQAMQHLNDCFAEKQEMKGKTMKELARISCELNTRSEFRDIVDRFKSNDPLRYYFITPMKMFKEGIFQSNTLFFGSLNPAGRQFGIVQIIIKGVLFILNIALFLSALLFAFSKNQPVLKRLVIWIPVLLMLSMPYIFFRYMDARYLLPVYPYLYISLAWLAGLILQRFRKA